MNGIHAETVENLFLQLDGERKRETEREQYLAETGMRITTFILIETSQNGMPLTDIKSEYDIPFDLLPHRKHQRCKGKTRERRLCGS